ncbi:branched-chain amino acid ABC transporter permease [Parvibaculum sp.]|uniref:branched-chain amino acid ABC transporter permease n=1 Tax=Parvibaculum sp. TaxID=2024848 RepID=UPI002725C537|nr:branched-chain amino acid ABC transporter permease [Parvibaculum sp.]MDO9127027.1 branched-chain amino acid ABC transporter permease [Parvibaculum sp.]MDP1628549.1 branched-chain amino acid ABC transporter permease [Parvibaculum sp.]MDP2151881.1 branched-chain amino acid ABC transporter permease [Parvibaculum sp.]MDP3330115.1 branched-chain amino acid ABC transporter permease [Parvibaculum sp.]
MSRVNDWHIMAALALFGIAAPFLLPGLVTQLAFLWLMVVFALTWDMLGGRMGYNSFGNIVFFGIGCYAAAVLQRDAGLPYFEGLALGLAVGAVLAVLAAIVFGAALLGIRGHYFAIGTLGLGIAAGEIASGWRYVGAGSGLALPLYPGDLGSREFFFCYSLFALAALCFLTCRWLYGTRFGLALNAIRDDQDKADAMGLRTTRIKIFAWSVSAFFLGISGGLAANMIGFIDPRDVAFAGATFGVWMVLMAILGGKGTLWGPVLGAFVFHVTQELFWTYLLGWQRVALGLLIVVIVVFFPQGIMGWLAERRERRGTAA